MTAPLLSGPKPALHGCPFCGAAPHWKLSKVKHDQLHGDPYQYRIIACPKGHAQISRQSNDDAAAEWNHRGVFSGTMIDSVMAENATLRTEKHADAEAIGALEAERDEAWNAAIEAAADEAARTYIKSATLFELGSAASKNIRALRKGDPT